MPTLLVPVNMPIPWQMACILTNRILTTVFFFIFKLGLSLTADTKVHRNPSEAGVHSMALALPPSQAK